MKTVSLCILCLLLLTREPLLPQPFPLMEGTQPLATGTRTLRWQTAISKGWFHTLYARKTLIVAEKMLITGRDPRTGSKRWTLDASGVDGYNPPVDRLVASGEHVVAITPSKQESHEESTTRGDTMSVIDVRTGALLWSLASGAYGAEQHFNFLGVGSGHAVIYMSVLGILRGLDIRDGRRRWDSPLPTGCRGMSGHADAWVVGLLVSCGGRMSLRALDPRTGDLLWERDVYPEGQSIVYVTGGVVGLGSDGVITVHDYSGRLLYEQASSIMDDLAATAEGIVISRYDQGTQELTADTVDRLTGRVTHIRDLSDLHVLEGRVYAAKRMEDELQGYELVIIDPVIGDQTSVTTFPVIQACWESSLKDCSWCLVRTHLRSWPSTTPPHRRRPIPGWHFEVVWGASDGPMRVPLFQPSRSPPTTPRLVTGRTLGPRLRDSDCPHRFPATWCRMMINLLRWRSASCGWD